MKRVSPIVAVILFSVVTSFGQSFDKYTSLKQKADQAYDSGDYVTSLKFFQQILALPAKETPGRDGPFYYDVACIHSLNHLKNEALNYLEKSYATARSTDGNTPVGVKHLLDDKDLDFIRADPRFYNVVKKYYSSKDADLYRRADEFRNVPEVSYEALIDFLDKTDGSIPIKNKVIYWKKLGDSIVFNNSALPMPKTKQSITFVNCTFRLNFVWNAGNELYPQLHPFHALTFSKCHFYGRFSIYDIKISGRGDLRIVDCVFEKTFIATPKLDLEETWGGCFIERCKFHLGYAYINSTSPTALFFMENELLGNFHLNGKSIALAEASSNHSDSSMLELWLIDVDAFRCNKNRMRDIRIRTNVTSEFDFEKNEISRNIIFDDTYFPQSAANDIDWSTLDNGRVGLARSDAGLSWDNDTGKLQEIGDFQKIKLLNGRSPNDISDDSEFRSLMGLYSMFLNLYKERNDIESYNNCFVAVKELQSKRLEYLYHTHKTFEGYFSWKLSQLLKFYVVHGTKPARAIVISIYIIFLFGVFFFFFPSDWDVTSKKRLIQNFKDFIQKNEKGYVKPFFILIGGLVLSMLNALTLSLNAFITLGFGNIPTHGIARYVCVLEGFVGWFLLSIFTVAMINQVL